MGISMGFDIFFIAVLILYVCKGWVKGTFLSTMSLVGVLVSYVVALLITPSFSKVVQGQLQLARFTSFILSFTLLYFLATMIFSLIKRKILDNLKYHERNDEDYKLPLISAIGGAFISLITGVAAITIIVLCYGVMSGGLINSNLPNISNTISAKSAASISYLFFKPAAKRIVEDPKQVKRLAEALSNPYKATKTLNEVMSSEDFVKAIINKKLHNAVQNGDKATITQCKALNRLLDNQEIITKLQFLGIVPEPFNKEMTLNDVADKLVETNQRYEKSDKDIKELAKALLRDQMFESENIPKLLVDGRFHRLMDAIIFED